MSLVQQNLPFPENKPRTMPRKILVTLSETDLRYREECIRSESSFTESFLAESRCQRIGCRLSEFYAMRNYERALHLADEAVVMRMATWATEPTVYIDEELLDHQAKQNALELANDFKEWKAIRDAQRVSVLKKSRKS